MAKKIFLKSIKNCDGTLSVFEKVFSDSIEHVEILINSDIQNPKITSKLLINTTTSLIAPKGCCSILCNGEELFHLEDGENSLIIYPTEYIEIRSYSEDCILILLEKSFKE